MPRAGHRDARAEAQVVVQHLVAEVHREVRHGMPRHRIRRDLVGQHGQEQQQREHGGDRRRGAAHQDAGEQADQAGRRHVVGRAQQVGEHVVITERDVRRMAAGQQALTGEEHRGSDHHRQRQRGQADQDRLRGQDQAALRRRREGRADQAGAVLVRGDQRAEDAEQQDADRHEVEVDGQRVEPGPLHRVEVRVVRRVVASLPGRQHDERDRAQQRRHEHGSQRPQLDPLGGKGGPRPAVRSGRGVPRRGRAGGSQRARHHASLLRMSANAATAATAT